jgi:hypothetical protein
MNIGELLDFNMKIFHHGICQQFLARRFGYSSCGFKCVGFNLQLDILPMRADFTPV